MTEESTVANLTNRYALLGPYNQAVPLIIASVSVGTTIVNRTPVKLVGHLLGALIVGLIAAWSSNRFVSAFLGYTIGYVCTCFKNGIPDAFILTGIVIGFLFLILFNMATYAMTTGINTVYFLTLLASALAGVGGVYATESLFGSRGLYDFKGCSCDDCANTNQCLAPNNTGNSGTKILARRVS
jgi:multisubunit Na+/H+ antiporter MnhC subunit